MKRVRIGIIGAGSLTEWAIVPTLSGPDMAMPPDAGAWWNQRPSEIGAWYQAPATADLVALCDADKARGERVANSARIRAVYSDWKAMLREVPLDALICAASPEEARQIALEIARGTRPEAANLRVWIYGPPAPQSREVEAWMQSGERAGRIWPARPLCRAVAHRAALRLVARGEIGPISALALRWSSPLPNESAASTTSAAQDAERHFAAAYAAFDWLLACAGTPSAPAQDSAPRDGGAPLPTAVPARVLAGEARGDAGANRESRASSVWLSCANGVHATALFAPSETWSAPLPRLEICGTQGRTLICEGGRRVSLHVPREAARVWEPPGLAAHLSSANLLGVAEDLKAFLAWCVAPAIPSQDEARVRLTAAVRALKTLEAARQSLSANALVDLTANGCEVPPSSVEETPSPRARTPKMPPASTPTLPLQPF